MIATTPYCPEIAAKQHFYLIVNSNFHYKKDLDYLMFVSGVRAYVPSASPLPAVPEAKETNSKPIAPPESSAFRRTPSRRARHNGMWRNGVPLMPIGVQARDSAERRCMDELVEAIVGPCNWNLAA